MEEEANGVYPNNCIPYKEQITSAWLECEQIRKCDYRDRGNCVYYMPSYS